MIVAIDGEASSGKGTMAKLLAKKRNLAHLDTGLMYRYIAFIANKNNILSNEDEILKICDNLNFKNIQDLVKKNNLHTDDISAITSNIIAVNPKVRKKLVNYQQSFAKNYSSDFNGVVIDGRDIGSVVFPNANIKFFITADLLIRAKRRFDELKHKDENLRLEDVIEAIKQRDYADKNRKISPLKKVEDSIMIDTSQKSIESVLQQMLSIFDKQA